eukprot:725334-Karenia_brevis.AAC.1
MDDGSDEHPEMTSESSGCPEVIPPSTDSESDRPIGDLPNPTNQSTKSRAPWASRVRNVDSTPTPPLRTPD